MELPTKEVLETVLEEEIYEHFLDYNDICYSTLSHKFTGHRINIYELMDHMKYWLLSNSKGCITTYIHQDCVAVHIVERDESFVSNTEFDATSEACRWLMENYKEISCLNSKK